MAALFCFGLLLYFLLVFRRRVRGWPELAMLLWLAYFALGLSALVVEITAVLQPVYPPNYLSTLFLLLCVSIGISGFLGFRAKDLGDVIGSVPGQGLIEGVLIVTQIYATLFFLPFAIMSLTGDANENRLDLANKMELLAAYGILNTVAGAASQLFSASLVLACIRLAQPARRGRSVPRACVLVLASLSYVIYIFAYVGRDGAVYWLMTALAVFLIFQSHLPQKLRRRVVASGIAVGTLVLAPFVVITVARFTDWQHGTGWSILEYFGTQINNFSDYSSIDRPMTLGVANFPMFIDAACSALGLRCENWENVKEFIFQLYLVQDKEPWLFGTYVSDFVGDFGFLGTLILLSILAMLGHYLCRRQSGQRPLTLSRLLLIMLLFLVPYWGVFYFRFSIANGFIIVNLAFVFFVWLVQRFGARSRRRESRAGEGPAAAQFAHQRLIE